MSEYSQWYEHHYGRLTGHGLWLRGGELNTLPAREFEARSYRFLITRLSTYRDTSESFTHTMLYAIAAENPDVFPDLSFLPPPKDVPVFAEGGVPWMMGTNSKHEARDFDLIGLSNSIVQELINLPAMLSGSGIPLRKSERMRSVDVPLVVMGGANAFHSTVFWTEDPPVDGIFVGEDTESIAELIRICAGGKRRKRSKAEILTDLESVAGFFQPEKRPVRVQRAIQRRIGLPAGSLPVAYEEGVAGTGHVQISEGCPCFCSFCAESFARKPYREAPAQAVLKAAKTMKAGSGAAGVDLYSFNFNMHSDLYQILWDLSGLFPRIGLKSQRLDSVARNPLILEFLHAAGKTSITVGIEGVSGRLRRYLNKGLPETVMKKGLKALLAAPLRELKIFLIATGLEMENDLNELRSLVSWIHGAGVTRGRGPRVIFSVTPLVRFPGTPLEFADDMTVDQMDRILEEMRCIIERGGFECRNASDTAEYRVSQLLVRARDGFVQQALMAAIKETGFVYYREMSEKFLEHFERNLRLSGSNVLQKAGDAAEKPWSGAGTGVRREFIEQQFIVNSSFSEVGYCHGSESEKGTCLICGACPDPASRKKLTEAVQNRGFTPDQFRARIKAAAAESVDVPLRVNLGDMCRGLGRGYVAAVLASALMKADERLVETYWGFKDSFAGGRGESWITGDEIITLQFRRAGADLLLARLSEAQFILDVNKISSGWLTLSPGSASAPQLSLIMDSEYVFSGDKYLLGLGLKFSILKKDGSVFYQLSKDSLKKRFIRSLSVQQRGSGCTVWLNPDSKLDVQDFFRNAFLLPYPEAWVRIKIRCEITCEGR